MEIGSQGLRRIRPSVFISSTSLDLIPHREKIIRTLLRMDLFPVAMEQFGANTGDATAVSLDKLGESDVYLGIIAWRYGYVPTDETRSVTQMEYQAARKQKMPCYLFLADPETQQDATLFPADLRDPDHRAQLQAFRAQIQKDLVVDYFTTPDDLALKITAPLHDYLLKKEQEYQRQRSQEAQQRRSDEQNGLLRRVDSTWVSGALTKSLAGATFIPLGLHERPQLVQSPWKTILEEAGRAEGPLPAATTVTEVFDDTTDVLMLLGDPGSGKSTLLLQLTRDLLDRAKRDASQPVPAVFTLATWALKRQPLAAWLIDEMNTKYGIARPDGKAWLDGGQVLPVLDGLDEVAPEYRAACVRAINDYLQTHHRVTLVIGSRLAEYEALDVRISGGRALQVQPMSGEQVHAYLASAGEALGPLQDLIRTDPAFAELAQNPLMLSVLIRTYREGTIHLNPAMPQEAQRQQIFRDYVEQMLGPGQAEAPYSPPQTKGWLNWLAGQMQQRQQTTFYLERMQMDWLSKTLAYRLYFTLIFGLVSFAITFPYNALLLRSVTLGLELGLVDAALAALFVWFIENDLIGDALFFRLRKGDVPSVAEQKLRRRKGLSRVIMSIVGNRLIFALFCGVLDGALVQILDGPYYSVQHGLLFGAYFVLMGRMQKEIQPAELLNWSWRSVRKNAFVSLAQGLVFGALYGLSDAEPYYHQLNVFLTTVAYGVTAGFSVGVMLMFLRGYAKDTLDSKKIIKPNQGIRNSLSNSLRLGVISGLALGGIVFLLYSFVINDLLRVGFAAEIPPQSNIYNGLSFGLAIGYMFWLINGGFAVLQHYVLRYVLWRHSSIPVQYARFLDYADNRTLLRKIGGGYAFIHKRFLDYFAVLDPEEGTPPQPLKSE